MDIVMNSVIVRFSWVNLVCLAASTVRLQVSDYRQLSDYRCPITANCPTTGVRLQPTVRLQVSDYSQLSDYNFTEWLVRNKAANASITFEKIAMVMINSNLKGPG